jgi:hypothetical protein
MIVTPAPLPPTPADPFMTAPAGMMYSGMGGMYGERSMGALHHQLSTLKQLRDEEVINEEEWRAKKSKLLAEQLKPGDLRSDLGMVKELHDNQVICDDEQADLRARLLQIEEPKKN